MVASRIPYWAASSSEALSKAFVTAIGSTGSNVTTTPGHAHTICKINEEGATPCE
jgi:hypothetical protein